MGTDSPIASAKMCVTTNEFFAFGLIFRAGWGNINICVGKRQMSKNGPEYGLRCHGTDIQFFLGGSTNTIKGGGGLVFFGI